MSQRNVEHIIGRLIADEPFRAAFLGQPGKTLADLCDRGLDLTPVEIAALLDTDPAVWVSAAERIDPRLHKASLTSQPASQEESTQHV